MSKQTTIKTIEQNDNVSLYSICFNGDELSEYEKFLMEARRQQERIRKTKR